jgi:hypothetical protein
MAQSETRARALADAQGTAHGRELEQVRQNQRIEAMNIDKIRVGDLVLSQDPNTGELTFFLPVLQTSQRPPERLVKVSLGTGYGDAMEGSGGHPPWVAGEGWVKLRDLQSGMVLHRSLIEDGVIGRRIENHPAIAILRNSHADDTGTEFHGKLVAPDAK